MEPIRFSVFGEGQDHKVTVIRNAAGEFVSSASPIDERIARAEVVDDDQPQASSLYTSLHHTAERQGIPADVILQIFKIHAYETDFRQRVRAGDGFEFFFFAEEEDKGADGSLGDFGHRRHLAGETHDSTAFTPDGVVDYYDEQGNTSRKFLMPPGARRGRASPRGTACAAIPSCRCRRCTPASTGPAPPARRSWRRAAASSRRPGARASTAPSVSATPTATGPPTATCPALPGQRGRQGAPGPGHRFVGTRPVLGAARAFRGAGQQQLLDPM
jgi:hypothetical protein